MTARGRATIFVIALWTGASLGVIAGAFYFAQWVREALADACAARAEQQR